jgi:hypothetical protein
MAKTMQFFPFEFAHGLLDVLKSGTPTISYFKMLPLHLDKLWAVYLLDLEKAGHRPRIYVGSGTAQDTGVRSRMSCYDRRSRTGIPTDGIPWHVEKSLQEGYAITPKGLLAWTSLPLASEMCTPLLRPCTRMRLRSRLLGYEESYKRLWDACSLSLASR